MYFEGLNGVYQTILADPPWDYDQRLHNGKRATPTGGAADHYPTMTLGELAGLPVQRIADPQQSILFMWTTGPQLNNSIVLMMQWGFDYRTVAFVWDKRRTNPGYYTMSQCEYVLAGVRGKIPKPRGDRNVRQFLSEKRTAKHSEKPFEIHRRIEQMFPEQRKCELFARERVLGWDCWGNEVEPAKETR